MTEYTGETTERVTPIRRNTWTKIEGEMETTTTSTSEYINHSGNIQKVTIKKATDNLQTVGETDYTTTNMTDFVETEVTYMRPRQRTWTKDDFDKFYQRVDEKHTTTTQDNYTNVSQVTDSRQTIIRHEDNLKMQGEFYTPEKPKFTPSERPTAVRPTDNLKPEGEFEKPEKPKYQPADIPKGSKFIKTMILFTTKTQLIN